jgi:hypothetical protein
MNKDFGTSDEASWTLTARMIGHGGERVTRTDRASEEKDCEWVEGTVFPVKSERFHLTDCPKKNRASKLGFSLPDRQKTTTL